MAYTAEKKAGFNSRLERVKAGLKARNIKYYTPAALALDPTADAQQLRNVMNGGVMSEKALILLEKVAGVACEGVLVLD
jgi:hypothetical protein